MLATPSDPHALVLPPHEVRTIAVLRALQLGDLLSTVPALRALRRAYPDAHIALIGLPWSRALLDRYPDLLDEHIEFPGHPGLPEQPWDSARLASFVASMRARCFDLVLQMQGDGSTVNPLASTLGARRVGGFARPEVWRPDDRLFLDYPDHGHEIDRMLALPRHLGIEGTPTAPPRSSRSAGRPRPASRSRRPRDRRVRPAAGRCASSPWTASRGARRSRRSSRGRDSA